MTTPDLDIVIVGAGLSGIGAGYHLTTKCPAKSFAILEARDAIGGTWDFFRYPGLRSDSDMYTLGYAHKPWRGDKGIALGPAIRDYIQECAQEHDLVDKIRFKTKVVGAAFSSKTATWTLDIESGDARTKSQLTCRYLLLCAGYYAYDKGYTPDFPGVSAYQGRVVHPQDWPADLDMSGKRVVVIGSGATAVTLIPELAKTAAHVTMLQRSPSYVVPWPEVDPLTQAIRRRFSLQTGYRLTRAKNIARSVYFYRFARKNPDKAKERMLGFAREQLPDGYDMAKHFTPAYKPWDQRVCLDPNAVFFRSIKEGRTTVVTDTIDRFDADGIRLTSGQHLPADIVVTATGLNLQTHGGMAVTVDGRRIAPKDTMAYKGVLFRDIPNMAAVFGYTNASWTLKADLVLDYVCRLINHMDATSKRIAVPRNDDTSVESMPWVDFTSGYFQRSKANLPVQGSKRPWRLYQNYLLDKWTLQYGRIADGVLRFE